jgi:class 3 adenylate cyclase
VNALLRFLDFGTDPGDDADLRARKRTAVGTMAAIVVSSVLYAIVGIAAGRPLTSVFAVLMIAVLAVLAAYLYRTHRLEPIVYPMVGSGMFVIASGIFTLGGVIAAGTNVAWALIGPLGAVLLLGPRAARPMLVLVGALVVGAVLLDPVVRGGADIPYDLTRALLAVNLIGAALVATGLVTYIDSERIKAKAQSDALLLNVLPQSIADRLKAGEHLIADHYTEVTVLFSDVVDFTPFAEAQDPRRVVQVLNDLFTGFDVLAERFGLEKIKTIGDAYMVVAGVPEARDDHAQVMLEMALAMHRMVDAHPPVDGRRLRIRTGIATGPVVAGVIGQRKFSYDLWGDTVNTASRMESSGIAGCIQVTPEVHARCAASYPFARRDAVEVKGKGPMVTWLLDPAEVPAALDGTPATAYAVH